MRIGVECVALKTCGDSAFSARKPWHNDDAGSGVNDSQITHLWRRIREQILERCETDVNNEREKADSEQSMRKCFSILRDRSVIYSAHQYDAGSNFDY